MLMSQSNLPSLWSLFTPGGVPAYPGMPPAPTNGAHTIAPAGYPNIEIEFDEQVVRRSNPADSTEQMRIKASPDSMMQAYSLCDAIPYVNQQTAAVTTCSDTFHTMGGGGATPVTSAGGTAGGVQYESRNMHMQRYSPDTTTQIPSVSDYPGEFGFSMSYGSSSSVVEMSSGKGALWTFSEQTQKLYVKMAATCPVKFRTSHPLPPGCYLRAMSVFKQPEHVKQVVTRCPNHAHGHSKDSYNEGHPAPSHLIRCEHPLADYQEDPANSRQSVVVPFDSPQVGTDFVVFLYNFMCYGSCVGGLNRRPIQVVFTLERDGLVLGRRAVEVRICACPSRDRKGEESQLNPLASVAKSRAEKRSSVFSGRGGSELAVAAKRARTSGGGGKKGEEGEDVYYVPVRGMYYYNLVTALYHQLCLHNGDMLPPAGEVQPSQDTTVSVVDKMKSECEAAAPPEEQPPPSPLPDHTPPMSPEPTVTQTHHESQQVFFGGVSESSDTAISAWLAQIGCSHLIDNFLSHNILHLGQVRNLSKQDLVSMNVSETAAESIMHNLGTTHSSQEQHAGSFVPQMMVRTASNSSMTLGPNGEMRQTRFTLHHSFSFVKNYMNDSL